MALIEDFRRSLMRLKSGGWQSVFESLGVDVDAENLRAELLRPIENIDNVRTMRGFEDLSLDANRPIEPRRPAASALFHALASPAVVEQPDGTVLTVFPTAADLELTENVVFGIQPPSYADIIATFPGTHLAIGVFAREYRQRSGTVHGQHADMIFSRTGITRVGTHVPQWDGRKRTFTPLEPGDDVFSFRILPCRYAAYVAVQKKGDPNDFGPYKSDRSIEAAQRFGFPLQTDKFDVDHNFWVPVHKLFSGDECLLGQQLEIELEQNHFNEKLRRIHLSNMGSPLPFDSGFDEPTVSEHPFAVDSGLAEFVSETEFGQGVLAAIPKPHFAEPSFHEQDPIGARVPESDTLDASFTIPPLNRPGSFNVTGAHRAPEWMHVRTQLRSDGSEKNLNEFQNVEDIVESGRVGNASPYVARHYTDFTGDGWIFANISGAPGQLSRNLPAYSVLAAPDFYPYVHQSDVLDWSMNEVQTDIRRRLWGRPPLSLCDQRIAPNLALKRHGAPFVPEDETVTAMVGLSNSAKPAQEASSSMHIDRVSYLPDGAAGFYAPGWDTSIDFDDDANVWHLAAHGLGSPFPEDAKLCAAISAFWPAVAPDTSRSWGRRRWRVIAPMIDEEIGLGDAPPWDGIIGPRAVSIGGVQHIENDDFDHVDYVRTAQRGKFTMSETMKVDQKTYQERILASHRVFMMLESQFGSDNFRILSFEPARSDDEELIEAQDETHFGDSIHKFVMVLTDFRRPLVRDPDEPDRWLVRNRISSTITVFVDNLGKLVFRQDGGQWQSPPIA